jgi:hypothetical protein
MLAASATIIETVGRPLGADHFSLPEVMMTRMLAMLVSGVAGLSLAALALLADDPAVRQSAVVTADIKQEEVDRWMQVKLKSAQDIFAGLTNGDFDQVETSARRMQVLHILEQWSKRHEFEEKSDYEGQLNAFEFATKELVRTARQRNAEGSLNAYTQMSQSCVRCHMLIRDVERP